MSEMRSPDAPSRVTDDPPRKRDLLALVDIVRLTLGSHRTLDGEVTGQGAKLALAALESLEIQLNRL